MKAVKLLESGEFSDLNVYFENEIYHLHKFPLLLKMGYVKERIAISSDLQIPFLDGGVKVFTDIVSFCYGKEIELNPRNIAFLSNAARILDMFGKQNLIELTDDYTNIIISDMRITHKFGPVIIALAYASTLKNFEYCDIFIRLFDAILSMWIRRSLHNEERLTVDPILTEFLAFLPDNVIIRIIQEISTMKSAHYALAELIAKFLALRFSFDSFVFESNIGQEGKIAKGSSDRVEKQEALVSVYLKKALACTCLPFDRLSKLDRDMLVEDLSGINYETVSISDIMDNIFSVLPRDIPLASKISVDWCKQVKTQTPHIFLLALLFYFFT